MKVFFLSHINSQVLIIAFLLLVLPSCIIQSPKYTTLAKVMSLQLGMSKDSVERVLGIKPYDLKAYTDTNTVFIYVYRITDRRTLSPFTKPLNGIKSKGKYVQLEVAYSKDWKVISIESCNLCPDNLVVTSKIDILGALAFITATLPALLIYLGLKK